MSTRWHRQAWRIEFRPVAGLSSSSMWHVAGTNAWVRLDGPDHLKDHCDLAKMDTKSVYEITGVPVDQNYGTITFYILSPPEKVELLRIVTAGDFADMQEFGGYNFYRVGIAPDGQWKFFVAGD